jgi:hypothetical protein
MRYSPIVILCSILLCSNSCKKDNNSFEQLPPITQTGANTFGCLINGQVFTPEGSTWSGSNLIAGNDYTYLSFPGGAYDGNIFSITATNKMNTSDITSIHLEFDSMYVTQGVTYTLGTPKAGKGYGEYIHVYSSGNGGANVQLVTSNTDTGQFILTRYDTVNLIASGTFWFNVIDSTSGDTIKITDGRFDLQY